ncbi:MAG: hypothetical protein GY853_16180 [PVC group bacterium]|nr:hypothetical protein [PVC group bacterium]
MSYFNENRDDIQKKYVDICNNAFEGNKLLIMVAYVDKDGELKRHSMSSGFGPLELIALMRLYSIELESECVENQVCYEKIVKKGETIEN